MAELLNFLIPLTVFLTYVAVGVFYCLSQQSAIRTVKAQNRKLSPGMVWIQLIPVVGVVASIIITVFVADSFHAEFNSHRDDSVLGIDAETLEHMGKRPTLGLGITYFALYIIWYASFVVAGYVYPTMGFITSYSISLALFIIATVFFIFYWIELLRTKRQIAGMTA